MQSWRELGSDIFGGELGLRLAGGGGAAEPEFIFRDEFITAESAPLATPRTAEPLGAWTVAQNDGQFSIGSDGMLAVPAQGTPANGDLVMYSNTDIPRATGLAILSLVRFSTLGIFGVQLGTGAATSDTNHRWDRSAFGQEVYDGGLIQRPGDTYALNTDIVLAIVLRSTGAYYIKDEELIAVGYNGNLANVRAKLMGWSAVWKADYDRIAQLAASFAPDTLAIYTDATPTANDIATGHQDSVHYIQWTPASAETFELRFRWVDDDNCMIFRCSQADSTAKLIRRLGGVETELQSVARTWSIGTVYRLSVRYVSSSIYTHAVNVASFHSRTNGYNSEVTGCKIAGAATLANWEIYPAIVPTAAMDEIATYANPFLSGSGRSKQTITVEDGGDIAAAIATMRAGDTLSLAANGTYTWGVGVDGFTALPSGFWGHRTTVRGNGATITGGDISLSLSAKKHVHFENLNLIDAVERSVLVTDCRWLTFDNVYADSNVNSTYLDVFRFIKSRDTTVTDCEAGPSTGWGEHDGFECSDQCGDITFTNCVAHGLIHGFEVWTGLLSDNVWKNYNITFLNCHSYDNEVGYSSEGGSQALAQVEIVADGCTAATNSQFDYQGIDGATLYIENNTGGTTNGSVTVRS